MLQSKSITLHAERNFTTATTFGLWIRLCFDEHLSEMFEKAKKPVDVFLSFHYKCPENCSICKIKLVENFIKLGLSFSSFPPVYLPPKKTMRRVTQLKQSILLVN